jgi:hypothetical protein
MLPGPTIHASVHHSCCATTLATPAPPTRPTLPTCPPAGDLVRAALPEQLAAATSCLKARSGPKAFRRLRPLLEPAELAGCTIWLPLPFWSEAGWSPAGAAAGGSGCQWHRVYVPQVLPQMVARRAAGGGSGGGAAGSGAAAIARLRRQLAGRLSLGGLQAELGSSWRKGLVGLDWGGLVKEARAQQVQEDMPGYKPPAAAAAGAAALQEAGPKQQGQRGKQRGKQLAGTADDGSSAAGGSAGAADGDAGSSSEDEGGEWRRRSSVAQWQEALSELQRGQYADLKILVGRGRRVIAGPGGGHCWGTAAAVSLCHAAFLVL